MTNLAWQEVLSSWAAVSVSSAAPGLHENCTIVCQLPPDVQLSPPLNTCTRVQTRGGDAGSASSQHELWLECQALPSQP